MIEHLHSEIAIYLAGFPFHLSRNPHYVSAFSFAVIILSHYLPPGYNMLRITLLQKERAYMEKLLEPIKGTWREKGSRVVSDSWTNTQRRPFINLVGIPESGPMFQQLIVKVSIKISSLFLT